MWRRLPSFLFLIWFAGHHPPLLSIVDALVSSSFCILLVAVGSFVANEWTTTRRTINWSLCTSLSETIEQRLLLTRLGARMIIETWTQVNVIRYGMRRRNPISMNVGRTQLYDDDAEWIGACCVKVRKWVVVGYAHSKNIYSAQMKKRWLVRKVGIIYL